MLDRLPDILTWLAILGAGALLSALGLNARRNRKTATPRWAAKRETSTMTKSPPRAPAAPLQARAAAPAGPIASALSWGYQLQDVDVAEAAASPFDLLVIDASRDGTAAGGWSAGDVAQLKRKPDGGTRRVICYLSIGEAETYRGYWRKGWTAGAPAFLVAENPEWKGNWAVRFWDPDWQAVIYGGAGAALDAVIAQGFDGVYLDKADVFEDLTEHHKAVAREREDIEADMVAFIAGLSRYAKARKPGFVIVMQNAESLVAQDGLLAAIDGVAKEELYFGLDSPEQPNKAGDVKQARGHLSTAKQAGKAVFVVEYLDDDAKAAKAAEQAEADGFVLYVSSKDRELNRLRVLVA